VVCESQGIEEAEMTFTQKMRLPVWRQCRPPKTTPSKTPPKADLKTTVGAEFFASLLLLLLITPMGAAGRGFYRPLIQDK
jgi:hypothetical protein